MASVSSAIATLLKEIPSGVRLIAVSKTQGADAVTEAYQCGQRDFGENRVPELLDKRAKLPDDIRWHMIGHLQTNKVKQIVPFINMIHSIDSFRLLTVVSDESSSAGRVTGCLLQIHIAKEESKFGFTMEELESHFQEYGTEGFSGVRICGVMGMATFTDDEEQVRHEFRHLRECFLVLKQKYFPESEHFKEISMGMSDDYPVAVEEGSTMVRIGSRIFGARIKR
jgi:PLP dependent protein